MTMFTDVLELIISIMEPFPPVLTVRLRPTAKETEILTNMDENEVYLHYCSQNYQN